MTPAATHQKRPAATHCPRGHSEWRYKQTGRRVCKECERRADAERRRRLGDYPPTFFGIHDLARDLNIETSAYRLNDGGAPTYLEYAAIVLAALRNEYGSWRIPSGYLRTDGSEVDGTDVVIPVPAAPEETPHA